MKKNVLFVLTDGYADWEGAFLASVLSHGGFGSDNVKYDVKTLSLSKQPITSFGGFTVISDYDINNLPQEYSALILLGGKSWKNEEVKQFIPIVEDTIRKNIIVGAICDASLFLGMYGFLNEISHTSNTLEDLKKHSTNYTGESNYLLQQVVSDKNIVTANGTAYLEFTREMLILLEVDTPENINKFYRLYKCGQYSD